MKGLDLLLIVGVIAYAVYEATKPEEGRVGEEPQPDFSNGFPGAQNQGFCSNPLATNWNPLAPPNNSEAEMVVTCAGLPEIIAYNDYTSGLETSIEQQADRMAYQLSLCTSDLTGQTAVARFAANSYPDGNPVTGGNFDTLSYCLPGEWLVSQITQQALMVAPEGTFDDGLQSSSSYEVHDFVKLPDNLSAMGNLEEGQVVSIKKLRPNTTYNIQDLIDYIYTPNYANKFGIPDGPGFIHTHPSHDEFVQRLQVWKDNPAEAAMSGEYRRVGDPRYYHPVDFDLDNSGVTITSKETSISQSFGNYSVEKNIIRQFFNPLTPPGQKTKADLPPHLHKIFDILDTDDDGFVDRDDFFRYVETTSMGKREDANVSMLDKWEETPWDAGANVSGRLQHYRGTDPGVPIVVTTAGYEDITEGQFSEQFFYSLFTDSQLEQCYNLRMPLWPTIEDGTPYNPSRGCTELFGVPGEHEGFEGELDGPIMSLVQLNKDKWVEVLYGTDGMACGDDTGEVLCFPFRKDQKMAAAEEYLEIIRPQLGMDTDPDIDWENKVVRSWPDPEESFNILYRFQEGTTLGAEINQNVGQEDGTTIIIPANDETFRAKIKSNSQCPASHPNFHRFCLTRRTLPSLIGPPEQIEPVYGVDDTTENT